MNELALYYMKLYYSSHRGVSMAMKMPSRILKKECAGILEGMKVNYSIIELLPFINVVERMSLKAYIGSILFNSRFYVR